MWETVSMVRYIPKVGDIVHLQGKVFVRYAVVSVDDGEETASVKTVAGVTMGYAHVPWSKIFEMDDSQNAIRIVREMTEGI